MNDNAGNRQPSRWTQKLSEARQTLVAVFLVLAVMVVLEPRLLAAAIAGFLLVAGVAALARSSRWPTGKNQGLQGTSADTKELLPARLLADALDDPMVIFDREMDIVFANKAAILAFGELTPGMALPLKFRAPEMVELVARVIRDGRASLQEYHERVPIERWYQVSAAAVDRAGGLFLLAFSDRGELRRIEKMRSDFIANASHELRTPLASISGFIETLGGPARNDPAAQKKFLVIMKAQTDRMARLIDDLLSLSRLEMKPYSRPDKLVDIRDIVSGVVRSLENLATEQGISVEEHYPDGRLEVPGDRDELIQVFENLLSNAYKYAQSGKRVVVSIERRKSDGADAIAVSIQDFGQGIPREHIPRITERFYRVDVETSRVQKGTGLGLSIVKHILTRHRGKLLVESEVGKGSTFTVVLPERGDLT
ncbi:MAG: two-component sensor histidine kinase [Notoacmeibacter sp.]|nr:two-component sensor histidine kinase [Notoacmeibacter sp.]